MSETQSRIKICHFASVHSTNDTRVFHRECVTLATYFDVTLIGIGTKSCVNNGVNIIALPKPKNRFMRILFTTHKAYKIALQQDAKIYHFHDPELIPFALLLKWKGKKVIYDIHENVTESLKAKKWLPFKFLFIGLYLVSDWIAASNFELILAEKAYIPVYKKRYPTKPIWLLENFAPIKLLEPFKQVNRGNVSNDIFYMGSFDHIYNYVQMLEATYLLMLKGWKGKLIIIGWVSKQIKEEMETLNFYNELKPQLEFKGYQEISNGYLFSQKCKVGFCFVSNNVNTRDSLPRKLYEYMCIGLPVISSNFSTYSQFIDTLKIGMCVDSNNPKDIAEKTWTLLHNAEQLNQFAQHAIKASEQEYNWENQEYKLLDIYKTLS